MQLDDKHVIAEGIVVWDGVTNPKQNDQGKMAHSLKIAIRPGTPELAELEALAKAALAADSAMKGQLPAGGSWPIKPGVAGEIDPALVGRTAINTKTYAGAPQVYDVNGRQLQPHELGPQLYAGAVVKVITHAYSFLNIQKGVAFGLDGIQIVDATTPKLSIAAGYDASKVFGAATAATVSGMTPAAPGVAPAPDFLNPGVTPAPPAPPAAPVLPTAPAKVMTTKAAGQPYDQFIAAGWTDAQLIADGYMV